MIVPATKYLPQELMVRTVQTDLMALMVLPVSLVHQARMARMVRTARTVSHLFLKLKTTTGSYLMTMVPLGQSWARLPVRMVLTALLARTVRMDSLVHQVRTALTVRTATRSSRA